MKRRTTTARSTPVPAFVPRQLDTILRMPDVEARVGLSARTISRLRLTGRFPPAVKLANQAIGWRESDVQRWITEREQIDQDPVPVRGRAARTA